MKKIETNELSEETKHSMVARIITGICIALVCVPCIILGSWYFFFLTVLITIFSAFEIVRVSNLKGLLKVLIYFVTIIFTSVF